MQIEILAEPVRRRVSSVDFAASHVKHYPCNGTVVAAEFGDHTPDAAAKASLARLYPDREILLLNIDPLGETGGGIHCVTQQQPKV